MLHCIIIYYNYLAPWMVQKQLNTCSSDCTQFFNFYPEQGSKEESVVGEIVLEKCILRTQWCNYYYVIIVYVQA